jgi:S-adenosylmethionine hydrolase
LNKVGAGYTLKASSGSLTAATTSGIAVTPSAATHLVVTTEPPSSVRAGSGFILKVSAEDAYGNVATSFTGSVTIALGTNPGGSTLGGTLTATASAGVASFSSLTLNKVGAGYTLKASSGSLTAATTSGIAVTPSAATHLVVTTEPPSSVRAGSGFILKVSAEDAYGNVATSFTGSVTIALGTNPGGSTLGGTLTATASAGVASFSSLTLNKVGAGYTLKASSGSLTAATTSGIAVTPSAATHLVVTTEPPSSVTAGSGFSLKVSAEDAYGNVATSFTGSVTIALGTNPGGSTLGGTLTATASAGVASFSSLTLNKVGSGYKLKASSGSLTAATTSGIAVTPAAATDLVVTTEPPSSVTAGSGFSLEVSAEDAYGNVVTGFIGSVTIALGSNPGGSTLGGTLSVTVVNGIATFTNLTPNETGTGYTLKVIASGLTGMTTNAFNVT